MRGVSWVNLGLGLWIAISALALHLTTALGPSDIAVGALAVAVAFWSLRARPDNHVPAWLSLAIGLWILMSPWVLHARTDPVVYASNALSGTAMMIFAIVRSVGSSQLNTM